MKIRYCIDCNTLVKNKKALRCKSCENKRRKNEGIISGKNAWNWQEENPTYQAIHRWLDREYGKPRLCEHCFTTEAKFFDWANITGNYIRDRNSFKRLCRSCHIIMDRSKREYCKNGHKMTNTNTISNKIGHRSCRRCKKIKDHKYYLKNKETWNIKKSV